MDLKHVPNNLCVKDIKVHAQKKFNHCRFTVPHNLGGVAMYDSIVRKYIFTFIMKRDSYEL